MPESAIRNPQSAIEQAIAAAVQIGANKFDAVQAWLDSMGGAPVSVALGRIGELEDLLLDLAEDELNRQVLLLSLLQGRADVADAAES